MLAAAATVPCTGSPPPRKPHPTRPKGKIAGPVRSDATKSKATRNPTPVPAQMTYTLRCRGLSHLTFIFAERASTEGPLRAVACHKIGCLRTTGDTRTPGRGRVGLRTHTCPHALNHVPVHARTCKYAHTGTRRTQLFPCLRNAFGETSPRTAACPFIHRSRSPQCMLSLSSGHCTLTGARKMPHHAVPIMQFIFLRLFCRTNQTKICACKKTHLFIPSFPGISEGNSAPKQQVVIYFPLFFPSTEPGRITETRMQFGLWGKDTQEVVRHTPTYCTIYTQLLLSLLF